MNEKIWTDAERALIKRLREDEGLTWEAIGERMRVCKHVAHGAIDPEFDSRRKNYDRKRSKVRAEKIKKNMRDERVDFVSIPQWVEDKRKKYLNAPHRSLADKILGAPPIGFSALDRKQVSA